MALPGQNSPRDIARRVRTVEQTTIPAVQTEIEDLRTEFEGELDIPDVVLLFNAALT